MFTDRRYQGLLPYLVTSALLVLMSLGILLYYLTHFGANQLYSQGNILSKTAPKRNLAVQVIYIHPHSVPLLERGTNLFLIGYADADDNIGYIGLEAKENDTIIRRLYRDNKKLINKPYRLEAELLTVGEGVANNLFDSASKKVIDPESSLGQEMDRQRMVSLSLTKQKRLLFYLLIVAFLVAGLVSSSHLYRLKTLNSKALKDFFTYYPELDGSLEKALIYASLALKSVDILIYKNHLLTYGRDIRLLNLDEVRCLKQAKKTIKDLTADEKEVSLPIIFVTFIHDPKITVRLKNVVPMPLTELLIYLNRYFPHIETDEVIESAPEIVETITTEMVEKVTDKTAGDEADENETFVETEEEIIVDLEELD